MSIWSDVVMVFRIDTIPREMRGMTFEQIFGKTYEYGDYDDWEVNPNKYLPMGSEGSLDMSICKARNNVDSYVVTIFGSLRDHEEDGVQALMKWFEDKCCSLINNQATITIDNSSIGVISGTHMTHFDENKRKWVEKVIYNKVEWSE